MHVDLISQLISAPTRGVPLCRLTPLNLANSGSALLQRIFLNMVKLKKVPHWRIHLKKLHLFVKRIGKAIALHQVIDDDSSAGRNRFHPISKDLGAHLLHRPWPSTGTRRATNTH